MDKLKLKPIDPSTQIKKNELRPATPGYHKYPSDMRYKILPGLCKSDILSKLNDNITNLAKMIKTQKPLTLKVSK